MMKVLPILIVAFLATSAFSNFIPVPDYNLAQIQGGWNVQSIYDTAGNDWALAYCFEFDFEVINSSVVNLTTTFFDGNSNELRTDSVLLYPDNENPAILYQDADHQMAPLLVLNVSSLPYWVDNTSSTTIVAFNYTTDINNPQYIIFGLSRWYDTTYDIRPFLTIENIPVNYTNNFWFINSACDTHYGWNSIPTFNASNIQNKTYNLIAVYEPAGSGLVPWYTGSGLYDWQQAYCASVSFTDGQGFDNVMTLSLKSLYGGTFQRTWQVLPISKPEAALLGFDIDGNTLLYVEYADKAGNIILTAGTTTSFFLSATATTLTPVLRVAFDGALAAMGWTYNPNLINAIDNSSC